MLQWQKLCKHRTKSSFPLRTSIVYSLSTTTGFHFETHNTAELEGKKKRMEKYCYLLSNYGMIIVHHIYFETAFLARWGSHNLLACEPGELGKRVMDVPDFQSLKVEMSFQQICFCWAADPVSVSVSGLVED